MAKGMKIRPGVHRSRIISYIFPALISAIQDQNKTHETTSKLQFSSQFLLLKPLENVSKNYLNSHAYLIAKLSHKNTPTPYRNDNEDRC